MIYDYKMSSLPCLCFQRYQLFCVMVDQSRQVDVLGSMARRPWTTDEFSHVLRTHTDMVRQV